MLKNLGYSAWALQVAQTVGPNWTNWTRDPNALENARIQLGQKLDQLNGGGSTTTSLSISSPGNNSSVSGSVNITTNTSNIVRAELSIDNVYKSTDTSSPFNFSWDSSSVGTGIHTITVVGYNASSQTSISSVTVNVSNVSPLSLSISSPVSGASVSGTITITPLVSANVVRVEYTVDGSYQATAYSSPFTFNWNTTSVGNGNHSITVVAYDSSGNNRIVSVAVAVNNSSGSLVTLAVASPTPASSVTGLVPITIAVSANVVRAELTVDGVYQQTSTTAPFSFSWNSMSVGNGNHSITVVA